MKQAVIAPSMLALLYPLDSEIPGYTREQFEEDLVDECEKDIRQAFAAGAARVSVDFTEGRLATRDDPRNPWTGRGMLPHFIELNNRVMDRFSAEERSQDRHSTPARAATGTRCTAPTCPTATCCRRCSASTPGYFLIQLASERDKDRVYQLIGENLRGDANGVTQMAYVGVINPLNPRVESPEEVRDALVRAANFIPKEQLGATDDCGFSPFSIDEKPSHGSPDFARETAWQKITNRVDGDEASRRETRPRLTRVPSGGRRARARAGKQPCSLSSSSPSSRARAAAAVSPSWAAMMEPFMRICHCRANESTSPMPASAASFSI